MATNDSDFNFNEEDVKNLFIYLSGSKIFIDIVKSSIVISSIENSGLFNEDVVKSLRNFIWEKSKDGYISFENFESIWITKVDERPSVKDARKHFINLIDEILTTDGYNPLDKNEFYLDKNILVKIILCLEFVENEIQAIQLAEKMINSIDSDRDGKVSLKDFEFLIEEYLSHMTESKIK